MSDYYDSSASEYEEEFDAYEVGRNSQNAAAEIATRIAEMQKLYKETIALAREFDVNVSFSLESEHNQGHNRGEWISWNSSSQYC